MTSTADSADTADAANTATTAGAAPGPRRPESAFARRVPAFFRPLATARGWAELAYALIALPIGIGGFVFTVVTVTVSGSLSFTLIGIPALAATGLASRYLGSWWRTTANTMLDWAVPAPRPLRLQPGFRGWLAGALKDGPSWRARVYMVLKLPLGIASFVAATVLYSIAAGGTTYWIWYRWLPCNPHATDGVCHRGGAMWNGVYLDTPGRLLLLVLVGIVALLLAPWIVRGILQLDRVAMTALLGPWQSARVTELERSRAHVVDDSAATLRRIERDLHDGTQARLVSLAMNIGLAKEKLAEGADPADAAALLDSAHATAKEAITEVRDLARGIHPAVLETGLDTALATLAARSTIPVALDVAITVRPAPAIESIAYFCAAELVTNAAKHSGATGIALEARTAGGWLHLRVADDGTGGARITPGGGLAGLADRAGSVDGHLTLDSPSGGPTVVTVDLPVTTGQPAERSQ